MATSSFDVSSLTTYVDEQSRDLIRKAVLTGRTIADVSIQPGVKYKENLHLIDTDLVIQDAACGFTPDGQTILTDKEIEVADLKIEEEYCMKDLIGRWTQIMLNPGSYAETENMPFEAIYSEMKTDKINAAIEDIIWKGNTPGGGTPSAAITVPAGNLQKANGFLRKIDDNSINNTDVTGGSASYIWDTNSVEMVDELIADVDINIIDNADLTIYLGYDAYRTYAKNLREKNYFHYDGAENDSFTRVHPDTNVRVKAVRGLNGTNRMVLVKPSNLYVGTDLMNDAEQFRIWYDEKDDAVLFRAKFKLGTQIAIDDYVKWAII